MKSTYLTFKKIEATAARHGLYKTWYGDGSCLKVQN